MPEHDSRSARPTSDAGASPAMERRSFLAYSAALGATATLAELARAEDADALTPDTVAEATRLAGLELTDQEREQMMAGVEQLRESYRALRTVEVPNAILPAWQFDPLPPGVEPARDRERFATGGGATPRRPADLEDLAFASTATLSRLVRARRVSSVELTTMYLERLRRLDSKLHCVITLTEERALEQARRADRELASGHYRGPLHGIPWGAKDLLAVAGYPTTWGATPYREQVIDTDATVVERLDAAGAVLVAKLTLGALAWGDVWYGETTRNPWNLEQGSSGSSAGSASATAAGLVGFTLGSETWGSIVSPSTRCGVSGLRPTFGRVSRRGAMALSWTMDKLGPIGRTVEDCAWVLHAIHGADGHDPTAVDRPFGWRPDRDLRSLRVGYVPALFESDDEGAQAQLALDRQVLAVLRDLGFELVEIELPDLPVSALSFILSAEAAAAFDELTRSDRDDLLVRQVEMAWPNVLRQARTIPAVEYIQANRVRTLLMHRLAEATAPVDVWVAPSFAGQHLLMTNLTGHPAVVLPNGFHDDGSPGSITFTGRLFGEADLCAVAHAYQRATDFHRLHPEL